jgi:hypothetical protein
MHEETDPFPKAVSVNQPKETNKKGVQRLYWKRTHRGAGLVRPSIRSTVVSSNSHTSKSGLVLHSTRLTRGSMQITRPTRKQSGSTAMNQVITGATVYTCHTRCPVLARGLFRYMPGEARRWAGYTSTSSCVKDCSWSRCNPRRPRDRTSRTGASLQSREGSGLQPLMSNSVTYGLPGVWGGACRKSPMVALPRSSCAVCIPDSTTGTTLPPGWVQCPDNRSPWMGV